MISKIKLYNFRSYPLHETAFGNSGTVIIGPNGTGKTNLLEAVYVALRGNSFRGSLSDCMAFNTPQTIIHLEGDFGERRIKLGTVSGKISKEFIINNNKSKILTRKNRLPVVLFEPSELRLISSSPSRRRDFLDGLIARIDAKYDTNLRAFNRTLLQRNELLKNHQENYSIWRDNLFAWDIKFAQYAASIAQRRAEFLQTNEQCIKNLYESLAGKNTQLSIEYNATAALENYDQLLFDRLSKSREYEIAAGFTSTGPHREDFTIFLHDQPAIKIASRGEMRTIMLAFKLLELELQTKINQSRPLILLDDVFSELDATREKLLQETIQNHQFIVTTTDARHQKDGCLIISTQ